MRAKFLPLSERERNKSETLERSNASSHQHVQFVTKQLGPLVGYKGSGGLCRSLVGSVEFMYFLTFPCFANMFLDLLYVLVRCEL